MVLAVVCLLLSADPLDALVSLDHSLGGEDAGSATVSSARLTLAELPRFWEQGDYLGAAARLQRAPPEPLLSSVIQFLTAESFAYGGRADLAAGLFEQLTQSEDAAIAQLAGRRRAETALALGHSAEAAEALRALLRRGPDSAVLEVELARALPGTPEGIAALRRAYLLDPEGEVGEEAQRQLGPGRLGLAGLGSKEVYAYAQRLLRAGHAEEALAAVNAVPRGELSGELEVVAAQCERALGHADAARQHLNRAAQLSDPKAAALAKIALARAKEAEGNLAEALGLLNQVARSRARAAEGSEALYLAAWMAMDHGDTQDGFRLFAQLAGRKGDKHAAEARWWTGWAEELIGKSAAAVAAWKPLLAPLTAGPLGPQVLYWSARAYEELGDRASAQTLQQQLLAVAPTSFYALLQRGGLPSEAASEVAPRCQDYHLLESSPLGQAVRRGELLWGLGLYALARAELDSADQLAHEGPEALAVADVESALGEPGRAFNLVQLRAAGCFTGSLLAPQFFPRPFRLEVERAAEAMQLDPIWIWAIMRQESRFERRARSQALAGGAMQLLAATSLRIATLTGTPPPDREKAGDAIESAAWYLRALSDRFGGELPLVAAAYNGGPNAVAGWVASQGQRHLDVFVEQIPYRETRNYVKAVVANAAAYRSLFGPPGPLIEPSAPPPSGALAGVLF